MNQKKALHDKLDEILHEVSIHPLENNEIGVLSGSAGIALLHFYYARLHDDETSASKGVAIITDIINQINKGYHFHTFCGGIAGAAWVIEILEEEQYIEIGCDELLEGLDHYFTQIIHRDITENFYDFLHGLLGIGYYILKRYTNTKSNQLRERYKKLQYEIIKLLKNEALEEDGTLKWESVLDRDQGLRGYNLSLSHGMSSIINFLARLVVFDDFKDLVEKELQQSIAYILQKQNKKGDDISCFPDWITLDNKKSKNGRLAWCYGDLGIGISLWRAGKALDNKEVVQTALDVLKHAALRRDIEDTRVADAGLCHGAFGVMHIFDYMYQQTQEPLFKEAADYWIDNGLKMGIHKDGYAGYMKWRSGENPRWEKDVSVLDGIAGIGLAIISYLSPLETKWNQSLMIG